MEKQYVAKLMNEENGSTVSIRLETLSTTSQSGRKSFYHFAVYHDCYNFLFLCTPFSKR